MPDDWWPEWLQDFALEDPLGESPVVVAEIGETKAEDSSYRHLFTALVPVKHLRSVLDYPGGIGNRVSANGPHPDVYRGRWYYSPRFWVFTPEFLPDGLEPLVVSWNSGNNCVLLPDQGFLMTYGLAPRLADTDGVTCMYWDDPSLPLTDVVEARTVSKHQFPERRGATVKVNRDYLQDYATIRSRALVQVYFMVRTGPLTQGIREILGAKEGAELSFKGRLLDLRLLRDQREPSILAQVWGVRLLMKPGDAPISAGRREYASLRWPGIPDPITQESARGLGTLRDAYVRDNVLGLFEGKEGFDIDPESGAVSYEQQWAVSYTRRVGRDHIAVDLRKLYEGCPQEVIVHWHAHAVPPPSRASTVSEKRNVGTRARRIVYGLADLGEALAELAAPILGRAMTARDFTGLDRSDLDCHWWWTAPCVEPTTRHIPKELKKDEFGARCDKLSKLVVEGLDSGEKALRRLLEAVGVPAEDIKTDKNEPWKSIQLLDHLVRLCEEANRSGLRLGDSGSELHNRVREESAPSLAATTRSDATLRPSARLFALKKLRNLHEHRPKPNWQTDFENALRYFGVNPVAQASHWGTALDAVYDGVGESLEATAVILARTVDPW